MHVLGDAEDGARAGDVDDDAVMRSPPANSAASRPREPLAVEALAHGLAAAARARRRGERRVARAAGAARRRSASGSSGATSSPFSPSLDELGDARRRRWSTTGSAAAIASTSTFGMPSRSPSSSTRQGRQNDARRRRYSSCRSAWPIGPGSARGRRGRARAIGARTRRRVLAVLRRRSAPRTSTPRAAQERARLDEHVEALLRRRAGRRRARAARPFALWRAAAPPSSRAKSALRPW